MADSLLYDLNHLPRAAPPPECVHAARGTAASACCLKCGHAADATAKRRRAGEGLRFEFSRQWPVCVSLQYSGPVGEAARCTRLGQLQDCVLCVVVVVCQFLLPCFVG